MDDQRAHRERRGVLTLKRSAIGLAFAVGLTAFIADWYSLVFRPSNPRPPIIWVYAALAALAIMFGSLLVGVVGISRRKRRYSLGALLLAVTIIAIALGTFAVVLKK
jgi:hypothetical protein